MRTTAAIPEANAPQTPGVGRASIRLRGAGVILVALAAAMAAWLVTARLTGMDLEVNQGAGIQPINPVLVAAAPIVSGLLGWLLLAILERASQRRAALIWRVIATVVLIGSLWSPITMAQSGSTMIVLLSMHFLVGAILIIGLPVRTSGSGSNG